MVLFKRFYTPFQTFFTRLRYPYSLPEEIAKDLGIPLTNQMPYQRLQTRICKRRWCPTTLYKFMPKEDALEMLSSAYRIDHFGNKEIVSYYFREGWIEFELNFDEESRLRRLELHTASETIEIPLSIRARF